MLSAEERRLLGLVLVILSLGLGWTVHSRLRPAPVAWPGDGEGTGDVSAAVTAVDLEEDGDEVFLVHVAGAVRAPGVYPLAAGARVYEAIDAAGGPQEDAVLDALNLAEPVHDAMRIYVPAEDEVTGGSGLGISAAGSAGSPLIDVNRASVDQLQALPGVGPVLAARIVAYRESHGPFRSVEDLLGVSGIGPKSLEQLRPHVVVR